MKKKIEKWLVKIIALAIVKAELAKESGDWNLKNDKIGIATREEFILKELEK